MCIYVHFCVRAFPWIRVLQVMMRVLVACDVHVLIAPWALGGCDGECLRVHVWEDVISQ